MLLRCLLHSSTLDPLVSRAFPLKGMTSRDVSRLNRAAVSEARQRIKDHAHRTPVLTSSSINAIISSPQSPEALRGTPWQDQKPAHPKFNFFFKCENLQKIGAFKIRGASHALSKLSQDELRRGVVTHSSGLNTFPFTKKISNVD